MTKYFFPLCSMVLMCTTSLLSIGSFIAGMLTDNYYTYAVGFGLCIITLSVYRDYRRETPRKSITVSVNSYNRIKNKVEQLHMNVIFRFDGEDWVELIYAEIETERLMNLLFKNQVKVH